MHFILTDRYLCDFLRASKYIATEINENFHEFIAGRELTALSTLAALCPVWLDDFGRGRTTSGCWSDFASVRQSG